MPGMTSPWEQPPGLDDNRTVPKRRPSLAQALPATPCPADPQGREEAILVGRPQRQTPNARELRGARRPLAGSPLVKGAALQRPVFRSLFPQPAGEGCTPVPRGAPRRPAGSHT